MEKDLMDFCIAYIKEEGSENKMVCLVDKMTETHSIVAYIENKIIIEKNVENSNIFNIAKVVSSQHEIDLIQRVQLYFKGLDFPKRNEI